MFLKKMKIGKTLYVTKRKEWRSWLAKNHHKKRDVWLIYYRKSSGRPRICYNDAVEEALCYGWIDSIVKPIDKDRFAQRFSQRNPRSHVSEMNKERIRRLIKAKRMTPAGLRAVARRFDHKKDRLEKFSISHDILKALKKDKMAWKNFQRFPKGYQRVRVGYIESRRRHGHEAFQKSLKYLIKMTAKGKRFGFVRE